MVSQQSKTIKICGLRDGDMISVAVEAGATAIGLMLAPSRREVTIDQAAALAQLLRDSDVNSVGVVVNPGADGLNMISQTTGVDVIQLSGDESTSVLDGVRGRFWKALRFAAGTSEDDARRTIDAWVSLTNPVEAVLIDASVVGAYGGTGHRADWDLVARLAEEFPLVLAGGLNPGNVQEAIAATAVVGVDVSSGVEKDGAKHPDLIREFVDNARLALP